MFCTSYQITTTSVATSRIVGDLLWKSNFLHYPFFCRKSIFQTLFQCSPKVAAKVVAYYAPPMQPLFWKASLAFQKAVGYHLVHIIINAGAAEAFWQLNVEKIEYLTKMNQHNLTIYFLSCCARKVSLWKEDRFPNVCHERDEFWKLFHIVRYSKF
jgi:hypothetical protein